MGDGGNKLEIEVRSLNGESIRLSIEPNKTVQDLKILLRQRFSPASSSPNFHLFLKGVKLNLRSEIGSFMMGEGDFVVIVPFVKKDKQQMSTNPSGVSETPSKPLSSSEKLGTKLAESAWSDLMQYVSSMHDVSNRGNENPSQDLTGKMNNGSGLLSILQSSNDSILDEENIKKFIELVNSSSCLTDPATKSCVMRESIDLMGSESDPCTSKSSLCHCPMWLRDVMKAFSFINMYSVHLELFQIGITVSALEKSLEKLHKYGFRSGIKELEQLSQVCPQVIHFVNNNLKNAKFQDAIIIVKVSAEKKDQQGKQPFTAAKPSSSHKMITAMKRRETSLRTTLSRALRSIMLKDGTEKIKSLSIEDLIHVKKTDNTTTQSEVQKGKRRRSNSATSSAPSCEVYCRATNALLAEEMVEHLKSTIGSQEQVVHVENISARKAKYVEIPCQLSKNMKSALNRVGITKLYSHQSESIQASLAGKNVIVATMTSSGKSLCYNIPVLEVLLQDPLACAIYLFPTKALAQDQMRALSTMTHELDRSLNIGIYDGDTSQEDRLWLRDNARLLITNPDMLHVSILPFHGQFRRILSNLRFIIIDEAHTYKGAFGCHAALIFRRLRRICSHVYSSDPSFIFSTATSANPREHAMELANLPAVELIENDGSPSSLKLFMLWNPPICLKTIWKKPKTNSKAIKSVVSGRSSPIVEVSHLFAEMVQHGLRCITFCKTRKLCELVLCYTSEVLQESAPHLVDKICSYRAGYIPEDRRKIESDLFNGNVCGIAATNALELGIDVGHIDVTLHLGFPGSIASLWQQAGRSGRRENTSLSIYVAFEGPLDQYFMKLPEKLFRGPIECCHVNATNDQILQQHLSCAALEHPLSVIHDGKYFGPGLDNAITILKDKGSLSSDPSRDLAIWTYIGHEKSPSSVVNVRAMESIRYKVMDQIKNEVLEEIEESKAFFQVYEGAVYMNQGKTFLVKNLDLSSKIAWCQKADVNYYTKTRDLTDVHIIGSQFAYTTRITNKRISSTTAQTNTCRVTTTWFGFRRVRKRSNQVLDTVDLSLPDYSYESQAVWIRVPQSVKAAVEALEFSFRGGLHAAGHALLNVVPLFIMCNQSDLASECANPYDNRYIPERLLLYDPRPGGTGISAKVQPIFMDLLMAASELLDSCHCMEEAGCPNCVQNLACHEYNEVLHKDAALMIIKGVIESEQSNFKST